MSARKNPIPEDIALSPTLIADLRAYAQEKADKGDGSWAILTSYTARELQAVIGRSTTTRGARWQAAQVVKTLRPVVASAADAKVELNPRDHVVQITVDDAAPQAHEMDRPDVESPADRKRRKERERRAAKKAAAAAAAAEAPAEVPQTEAA